MALWGSGVWDVAKWSENVGQMAATETGVDVFSGEGDVVLSGVMAATESTTDTFAALGIVEAVGQMAAVESEVDVFAATGTVQVLGDMAATESQVDTFAAQGDVNLAGTMAATETGVDVFSAEGDVTAGGVMAATETEVDTFYATGRVDPPTPVNPVTADIGPGDEKQRKKAQKKRDEAFERERAEREGLRQQIKQAIDPVVEKAAPVVVSKGTKAVQVLSLDGSRIGINVPAAFDAAEVARLVAEALEEARGQSRLVAQRQEAERARAELARIIKRQREDEFLLLMD